MDKLIHVMLSWTLKLQLSSLLWHN